SCFRVARAPVTRDAAAAAARIDGALLVDQTGDLVGIGAILDGEVVDAGTNARGSRYNSALRYVQAHKGTVALVISDDGSVDVLPKLRPRISRSLPQLAQHSLE